MPDAPELAKTVVNPSSKLAAPAAETLISPASRAAQAGADRTLAPADLAKTAVPSASAAAGALLAATACPVTGQTTGPTQREGRRTTVLPTLVMEGEKPQVSTARRDRFEELSRLGQGGMGEVVLLQDHDIDRAVALKRLPAESDLGSVLRFVDEIRTVGSLEHPNIVPVHDVGIDEQGRYFFVMKHLKGETLESIVEKLRAGDAETHRRYTFAVRQQLFLGVLNAVNYAHREGVIHRDLKPSNIMVGPFGEVTVMDWGLAKRVRGAPRPELPGLAAGAKATQPVSPASPASSPSGRDRGAYATQLGDVMGTPMYMSPEQARGDNDQVDERTDTYALTVIFHELMFLEHYLDHCQTIPEILDGVQVLKPSPFSMKSHPSQGMVPPEFRWYVDKGIGKDPAQRFQSVQEMLDRLQRGLGGHVLVQCQFTLVKRVMQEMTRYAEKHPMLLMAGGIVTVASMGFGLTALVKAVLALL
ncbi:MAG TPA: serine/threonine-protein kinase [Myxococcales bacterium]|jgi:serine/threonine-protein kinase